MASNTLNILFLKIQDVTLPIKFGTPRKVVKKSYLKLKGVSKLLPHRARIVRYDAHDENIMFV